MADDTATIDAVTTAATSVSREERRRLIEEETAHCIELYREHESAEVVAGLLGVKRSRVLRRLRDADVSLGLLRVDHTVAVFKELGSIAAVSERMGLREQTVRKRLFSAVVLGRLEEIPEITEALENFRSARESRRLAPEKEAETVALYEELRSLRAVARRLGLTPEAVRLRLKNAGVSTRQVERLTDEERAAALRLYPEVKSVQAVAAALSRSPLTIRRALAQAGVEITRGAWHETQRDVRAARKVGEAQVMKRLFDQCGSEVEVARLIGVSQSLVSARLALIGAAPGRGNHVRGPRAAGAAKARAIYQESGSVHEAAAQLGVSYRTALRYLHASGVETKGHAGTKPLRSDDIERTYAIYRSTYSIEETAAEIGRSKRTVLRHIQRARQLRAERRALRAVDEPVPLDPPDKWEQPARLPVWMREEDLIWAEVDDLRTLERTAQGKYLCPLCGQKVWEGGISRHLRQPHARCPESGCDRIVVAAGVPSHHWNIHIRPKLGAAAGRRGEVIALRRRDLDVHAGAA